MNNINPMTTQYLRRTVLGMVGAIAVSGCLTGDEDDDDNLDGEGTSDSDSVPEGCDLQPRDQLGKGEPVEQTIEVTETEDPTRDVSQLALMEVEDLEDLERDCARAAAHVAYHEIAQAFEFDLADPPLEWMFPEVMSGKEVDGLSARVIVRRLKETDADGGTSFIHCPDPSYDFDTAVETAPQEVIVTLQSEDGSDLYQCTHDIRVHQRDQHED